MTAFSADAALPPRTRALREAGAMLRLAGPVIVARAGLVVMLTVDTLMTGMVDAHEIAFLGLGLSPVMVFMLATVGLLQGSLVLVAQANGAGEHARCGAIWRVALLNALVLSSVFGLIGFVAEDIFLAIGQDPGLAKGAAEVTFHFAWGMPGVMLYVASGYFLEGIGRPRTGMVIMLAANIVNVFADGIFAVGWWGLVEPMGAVGAVITTSAIRWGIFVAILIVILTMRDRAAYGVTGAATPIRAIAGRLWKLGAPIAGTGFLENGAYATLAQLAGLLGAASLAAHQVTINVMTLAYMGANGMAAATSVRVGFSVGRGDQPGIARSGWTGIALGTVLMGLVAVLFVLAPTAIADIFLHTSSDSLGIAGHTVMAAGVFIVFAGAMATGMGALRGAGDMIAALGCYALAYVAIGIPAAWAFAFRLGWGAPGLIYGLLAGVLAGLVLLLWRFRTIARRVVARA
ncbi:MAG: MATE family efflux transporter [Alphaproteobacteria bacterium]|nr:MATE family efflux transporter [Alphaproteobacteria bacterium]